MQIHEKTPLARLRELRDMQVQQLIFLRAHEGESPVVDENIRHKQQQIRDYDKTIELMEKEAATRSAQSDEEADASQHGEEARTAEGRGRAEEDVCTQQSLF